MIPRDYITEWRVQAPWVQDFPPMTPVKIPLFTARVQ